jgi:hypothetical protein
LAAGDGILCHKRIELRIVAAALTPTVIANRAGKILSGVTRLNAINFLVPLLHTA